jgi:hypothetical protein
MVRRARATPVTRVADLMESRDACVRGRVVALDAPVPAPISGRVCVLYEAAMIAGVMQIDPPREVRGARFAIADASGQVDIDPVFAACALGSEIGIATNAWAGPTPTQAALVERLGGSDRGWLWRSVHLLTESVLLAGEDVAILGSVRLDAEPAARMTHLRGAPPTRATLVGSAAYPLVIVSASLL